MLCARQVELMLLEITQKFNKKMFDQADQCEAPLDLENGSCQLYERKNVPPGAAYLTLSTSQ